ncbi:hypothetical protein [Absidia glauca]|uniref:Zinc finger PHD-type domain-containing protein n=1 Tax=Absidia glauca TaxID=4829 RepID=A0A163K655_ABSGL|nr:hypothetical protein [Absidia glauca]
MAPPHSLPYDLSSLTWNEAHTRNDQAKYCYCGKDYKENKAMIRCELCQQLFHPECVPSVSKPMLYGDVYYDFECSVCTQADEKYQRRSMKWKEVVTLVLYHITMQRRFSKGQQQENFFFRFSTEICDFLESHWDTLLFDRSRPTTWRNTVASTLSTHPQLFLSGAVKMEEYGKGWWALKSEEPPKKHSNGPERQSISKPDKKLKKRKVSVDEESWAMNRRSSQSAVPTKRMRRSSTDMEPEDETKDKGKDKENEPDQKIEAEKKSPLKAKKDEKEKKAKRKDKDSVKKSKKHDPPAMVPMSQQEEWQTYQTLDHAQQRLTSLAARFKRKLALRRLKRNMNLKLFDLDHSVSQHLRSKKTNLEPMAKSTATAPTPSSSSTVSTAEMEAAQNMKSTKYSHSFASRLYGRPHHANTLTSDECWLSAWNGRKLRPYIRRDYENKPVRMQLLEQIKAANGRPHHQQQLDQLNSAMSKTSIDYVYFQREHLEQANQLLARCFWDGVDVSESLQFPEFSVIALYKRCVIGCAFMTPEAYITYFAVMAGWERAGIGQ